MQASGSRIISESHCRGKKTQEKNPTIYCHKLFIYKISSTKFYFAMYTSMSFKSDYLNSQIFHALNFFSYYQYTKLPSNLVYCRSEDQFRYSHSMK